MKKWTDADMLAFANKMAQTISSTAVKFAFDFSDLEAFSTYETLRFDFTLKFSPSGRILEVRRASDGEVFKLGDSIQYNGSEYSPWAIESFKVRDGRVFINDHHSPDEGLCICNWIKHKPYSLITEDGLTVGEGTRVYQVSKGQCYVTWMVAWPNMKNGNEIKYFASEANAQKYADTFKLPTDHIHDLIKKLVRTEVENQLKNK